MTCKELKEAILRKAVDTSDCLFLVYKDSPFLARQYAEAIADGKGMALTRVDSPEELPADDAFGTADGNLYVLLADEVRKLEGKHPNSVVICKKTAEDSVEMPKLDDWQVLDYMKAKCPGLSEDELTWLQQACDKDIYRIESETDKISIFPRESQTAMLESLMADGNYSRSGQSTPFDLVNAALRKDKGALLGVFKRGGADGVDAIGLATLLRNGMRNVIKVQFNPAATPESTGMKEGQFKAVKYYNSGRYANSALIDAYEFLASVDARLKRGELQMGNGRLIDYILCNVII
jgi:hypothetical protein